MELDPFAALEAEFSSVPVLESQGIDVEEAAVEELQAELEAARKQREAVKEQRRQHQRPGEATEPGLEPEPEPEPKLGNGSDAGYPVIEPQSVEKTVGGDDGNSSSSSTEDPFAALEAEIASAAETDGAGSDTEEVVTASAVREDVPWPEPEPQAAQSGGAPLGVFDCKHGATKARHGLPAAWC
jgi:hypothetical protein